MGAEALKISLIKKIANVDDPEKLKAIESLLSDDHLERAKLNELAKPMRKKLDLEAIKYGKE